MFENNRQRIKEILKQAEFDAQLWSDLLNASTGALELPNEKFTGKPIMLEPTENQGIEVDRNDGDGRVELTPLGLNMARKMLG